jgi:hypothetical protein
MSLDTRTLTTRLITDTTATVSMNTPLTYSYKNKTGLRNTYSVLGLIVSIETTKQRGWDLYETVIHISYKSHWGTPDGFSNWYKELKTSLQNPSSDILINKVFIERHTPKRLQEAHDIGVLAGESFVLTILNKYVELLFSEVNKEQIVRQIEELTSQLNKVSA